MSDVADVRGYVRTATAAIAGNADLRALLAVSLLVTAVTELYHRALPLYFRELAIPVAVLGIGLSVANSLEVVASPVTGVLADETDRFAMAAVAALLVGGVLVALWVAPPPTAVVALLALFAVGRLTVNHAVTPAVSDALDDEVAGIGWGIRDVAVYLGSAVGLAVGSTVLAAVASVRVAYLAAVPAVVVVAAVLWRRRESPVVGTPGAGDERRGTPGDEADDSPGDRRRGSIRRWIAERWPPSTPEIPRPPVMARFLAVTGLSNLGMGMSVYLLPLYAAEAGFDGKAFLLLFSLSFAVSAPLSVVGGVAADRFDRKRLYVANFLAETLMLLAFGFVDGPSLFLVGTALYVVQTTFEPAVITFFFDAFPDEESGRAWGIDGVASKGAGTVAPAVGGFLYARDPASVYLLGAVLLAGATVVAALIPRD